MSREDAPRLLLTTSPFLKLQQDTPFIMWQVVGSLVPVVLAAAWFFGLSALLLVVVCTGATVLTEWCWKRENVRDGSAVITGVLLALVLPPGLPLWMAFVGGVASIVLGKTIFGGLGYNIFNPALVGRVFLQAAFPAAMTTWAAPAAGDWWQPRGANLTWPFMHAQVDAVSTATPLAQMKFEHASTGVEQLLLGQTAGSLGETCAVVILICGAYLAVRGLLNWRIPVSIFATVAVASQIAHMLAPDRYGSAGFMLFSGGLVLGAVYMATDMVTSPVTQLGCWVFGIGIGLMVVVIRWWGGAPEGVMYAILFFNALTPLINRVTQPRTYGAQ